MKEDIETATRENARLLAIFSAQLKAAIDEASNDLDALSQAAMSAAADVGALQTASTKKTDDSSGYSSKWVAANSVNEILVQMQFADRMVQRLTNTQKNLERMARCMRRTKKPLSGSIWKRLLRYTRATFTMEQERKTFDATFGMPSELDGQPSQAGIAEDFKEAPILFEEERSNV